MFSSKRDKFQIQQKKVSEAICTLFGEEIYDCQNDIHQVTTSLDKLLNLVQTVKDELEFIMLLDICGIDNSTKSDQCENRFEVVYHLLNMEHHQRLRIRVPCSGSDVIPSIDKLWNAAKWYQREVYEMFGIVFEEQSSERLLTHNDFSGFPLRKDYKHGRQLLSASSEISFESGDDLSTYDEMIRNQINIGPVHPVIRGKIRIMAEMDDQIIKRSNLEIGYLHTGVEKIIESKSYNQIVPYVERLNGASAVMGEIGFCKTVEELLGLDINSRVKALRMVFAELSRINDHLSAMSNLMMDLGVYSEHAFCVEQSEKIRELFENNCGSRVNLSLNRVGGMFCDLPAIWISDCLEIVGGIVSAVNTIDKNLSKSKLWIDKLKVGKISAKDAILWGYSGPCLRASGVNYDIRKVSPYYFYQEVDFNVPIGLEGTCYDRYLVRVEEIRQSVRIINQVLNNLPIGNVIVSRESLMDIRPPKGEIYSSTESANGELGFYLVSDGGKNPYRLKLRTPSFSICQSLSSIICNYELSDALTIFTSLNISAGEVDR